MKYCHECGGRIYGDATSHVCDADGLNAMTRNPLLRLLMKPDGSPDHGAPVILGGGEQRGLHFDQWQIDAMRKRSPALAQAIEDIQRELP